jgi:hypothetical protein
VAADLAPGTGASSVTLALDAPRLRDFTALFQDGVAVPVRAGTTVLGFLVDQLAIAREVIEERVTTVFLDGRVVDDLERTALGPGSTLALSAALPGLVGATLRRNGLCSGMRAAITARPGAPAAAGEGGTVRLKLFNLLIGALGPAVLRHGVLLEGDAARRLLPALAGAGAPTDGAPVLLRVSFTEGAACN